MFENLILVKSRSIRKNIRYEEGFSSVLLLSFALRNSFLLILTPLDMILCNLYLETIINFVSFLDLSNFLEQCN